MVRESNSGGDEIFLAHSNRPWGPRSLPYNGYQASFAGVKRPECGVDHPPPSSAEIKKRVCFHGWLYGELYLSGDIVVSNTKVSAPAGI